MCGFRLEKHCPRPQTVGFLPPPPLFDGFDFRFRLRIRFLRLFFPNRSRFILHGFRRCTPLTQRFRILVRRCAWGADPKYSHFRQMEKPQYPLDLGSHGEPNHPILQSLGERFHRWNSIIPEQTSGFSPFPFPDWAFVYTHRRLSCTAFAPETNAECEG